EGVRPDVAVIGYRALGLPWYHAQLAAAHPEVVAASHGAMEAYRTERRRFDNVDAAGHDSIALAGRFVELVRDLLRNSYATRPLYVTPDVGPALLEGYRAVPDGLALRVFTGERL